MTQSVALRMDVMELAYSISIEPVIKVVLQLVLKSILTVFHSGNQR